jgi:hypothetical protein
MPLSQKSSFVNRLKDARGLIVFGALALPVLIAIWCVPWFVTQDGPLHLYNAHIMIELLKDDSPLQEIYAIRWAPLPYLGAHLSLTAMMSVISDRTADRVMLTLTSIGFAGSLLWLRWRVAGSQGLAVAAPLAVLLSLNVLWLLGLYSFMLGSCLFVITLGAWWTGRERMGAKQALIIAGLLVLGYFSHLISLAVTMIALGILALITPGKGWLRRVSWTAASLAPIVPLAIIYKRLMQDNGEVRASWSGITDFWSIQQWLGYSSGVDFLSLRADKNNFPFVEGHSEWFGLMSPYVWGIVGLAILLAVTIFSKSDSLKPGSSKSDSSKSGSSDQARLVWIILPLALILMAYLAPDSFGDPHGGILRERILLLGVAALVAGLRIDTKQWSVKVAAAALMLAAMVQVGYAWEYGLSSNQIVSDFMRAKPYVGTGHRVEILRVNVESRFRANPIHNLSNMLGIGTGNIVWNNYGPSLYYFPIKFKDESVGQRARSLSDVSMFEYNNPRVDIDEHLEYWSDMLDENHDKIDALVVWGSAPTLDAANAQWYGPRPIFDSGKTRVFQSSLTNSESKVKLVEEK